MSMEFAHFFKFTRNNRQRSEITRLEELQLLVPDHSSSSESKNFSIQGEEN